MALVATAGAMLLALTACGGADGAEPEPSGQSETSVAVSEPTVIAQIDIAPANWEGDASDLVYGAGSIWVPNASLSRVRRIDPATDEITATIDLPDGADQIAFTDGSVWVLSGSGVVRIDPETEEVTATIADPDPDDDVFPTDVVADDTGVWVSLTSYPSDDTPAEGSLARIDPATDEIVEVIDVEGGAAAMALDTGDLWVASADPDGASVIRRYDTETGELLGTTALDGTADRLAYGADAVWVTTGDAVVRIDPETDEVTSTIEVEGGAEGIGYGAEAVWVTGIGDTPEVDGSRGVLTRIDPDTEETLRVEAGRIPTAIAFGDGDLWLAHGDQGQVWRLDTGT